MNIVEAARANDAFRRVLLTGVHEQVVAMAIPPDGEIGEEVHADTDQVLVFVDGEGEARIGGKTSPVAAQELVLVPAGTLHNFVNTGQDVLKLYTIYAPPHHAPGTVHLTKAEADREERKEGNV